MLGVAANQRCEGKGADMSHMSDMNGVDFAYAVETARRFDRRKSTKVRYVGAKPSSKKKKAAKIGAFLWFFGLGI
jgi:hypothetical protein